LEELSNLAQESLGHPINLLSNKQVATAIYDELKLIPSLPTKTAKAKSDKKQSDRSTSAKVLLSMMGQHLIPSVVKGTNSYKRLSGGQVDNLLSK
jgi:DNA polymerase I-like protein with 3'-5' exonuclease and polymerase domains